MVHNLQSQCERNYLNKCRFFRKSVTFHIKMKFWLGYNLPYPHITQDATQWRATETPENLLLMTDIEDSIWAPRGVFPEFLQCLDDMEYLLGVHIGNLDLLWLYSQFKAELAWCQSKPYSSIHSYVLSKHNRSVSLYLNLRNMNDVILQSQFIIHTFKNVISKLQDTNCPLSLMTS